MKYNENVYKILIEPITPVYIGGASEKSFINGVDIVQEKGYIYVIDNEKLFSLFNYDDKLIQSYVQAALDKKVDEFILNFCKNKGISLDVISKYKFKYSQALENDIKTFIRDALGKPYIPGSSIKGAIRSALFHNFFDKTEYNKYLNDCKIKSIKSVDRETFVFDTIDNNLMKFIQISDFIFNETELICTKVFSLIGGDKNFKGGWKHKYKNETSYEFKKNGFTNPYEILKISRENIGIGTIVFNQLFFEYLKNKNAKLPSNIKKLDTNNPLHSIFEKINNYTNKHIDREVSFFEKYKNKESDFIKSKLQNLKDQIPTDKNACLLRLGGNTGFHNITGDWQFDTHEITNLGYKNRGQYNNKDSAKTRKIAFTNSVSNKDFEFYPFGFIKITLLSDKEYEKYKEEIENIQAQSEKQKHETKIIKSESKTEPKPEPLTERTIQPPKPYAGKLFQGAGKIPAQVIKSGKPNIVKLLITGNEIELPLRGYASEIETGKFIYVKVSQYSKGRIGQVNYDCDIM